MMCRAKIKDKKPESGRYIVTGLDARGKRFSIHTDNYMHAMGYNLYRGTVWELKNGKRKRIKSVYN
mgnify:CR=1 FL=1